MKLSLAIDSVELYNALIFIFIIYRDIHTNLGRLVIADFGLRGLWMQPDDGPKNFAGLQDNEDTVFSVSYNLEKYVGLS